MRERMAGSPIPVSTAGLRRRPKRDFTAMSNFPAQHQDQEPGREHEMNPRPDYAPRFPGSGRLKDKAAIITGGDSGIGRATGPGACAGSRPGAAGRAACVM